MKENLIFMMEMPYRLASWHKWAKAIYEYAAQYNRYLFDREGILALADELQAQADKMRNGGKIGKPDFDIDLGRCNLGHTTITVASTGATQYSIRFIAVRGRYLVDDGQPVREYYGG